MVVLHLLLRVVWGDVVWPRPLACGRWLELPAAAVTAAAEAAAAVTSGQDPAQQEDTLRRRHNCRLVLKHHKTE